MNAQTPIRQRRQTNWDWRAAGNFICGGSGTGLLLMSAIFGGQNLTFRLLGLAGLALIGLGLLCVWLEIGRPFRALNVFLHAHTSWMTREALVAPPLFLCGLAAVWTGSAPWMWATAALAMLFLYCQARIVNAAKGIPAWRAQRIVPLIIVTGWTEGAGLLAVAAALTGAVQQASWMQLVLVPLLIVRAMLWRAYRRELAGQGASQQAGKVFDTIELPFLAVGHWAAAILMIVAIAVPAIDRGFWLTGLLGLVAAGCGWLFKYTLIVRASFNQGFALPRVPVRGAGVTIRN